MASTDPDAELDELPPAYRQAIRAEVRDVLRQSGEDIAEERGWTKRQVIQAGGYVALGALLGGGGAYAAAGPAQAAATGEVGTSADPLLQLYAAEILGGTSAPIDFGDGVTFDHEAISSATTVGNVTYVYYDSSVAGFTGTIPASLENRGGFIVWIDEGASVASNNVDVTSTNWTVDGVASSTIDANQSVYILFANPNQTDWTSRIFTETVDARSVVTGSIDFDDANDTVNDKGNVSGTGGSAVDIDISNGNMVECTLTGATEFTFSGASTGGNSFILKVSQDGTGGRSITWPTVEWDGGSAPSESTGANETDVWVFTSWDGGTTWYGFQASAAAD